MCFQSHLTLLSKTSSVVAVSRKVRQGHYLTTEGWRNGPLMIGLICTCIGIQSALRPRRVMARVMNKLSRTPLKYPCFRKHKQSGGGLARPHWTTSTGFCKEMLPASHSNHVRTRVIPRVLTSLHGLDSYPSTAYTSRTRRHPDAPTARPTLLSSRAFSLSPASCSPVLSKSQRQRYHSQTHPSPSPFTPTEQAILSSALHHVPQHGFTAESLKRGARDAGYLDVSTNLFPRGAFDLINYHLVTQRLALKDRIEFATSDEEARDGKPRWGTGQKIRSLAWARLRANEQAGTVGRWSEVRLMCRGLKRHDLCLSRRSRLVGAERLKLQSSA